ncbi:MULTISPECIES: bis(5'-nucleosyl)-tetraphosphatase (symmetrical) YqeK [Lachnospiraceae]|uniref:bis(5'-nucleosyl)-tetraphosphatase (symmetrical) YqeK n=1 Tax=Lachnospiraceae TaxID=186803 RepID=UPI001F3DF8B8|nr:bis(5'-nucleosyl)-tetraphosphatase (symmetrical) YqeK [Faecalicatena contorta]MCI6121333.1 bis(5'-nucleosyl)-tetraphosphatase (symmetrical) YqeK [Lachnospiraceae bacterium]MCF2667008.1 bis(5'-nucleosyl)-tetraphosphatase (symmetrical) YqeK [Faecalicatena contorta]MCI6535705.1 bis(5'-nucleosyl)-tetraphosphatase (symmetrical) YqeK [Lachnospiraceae bacterium]MDY2613569.1 bis(5'-nucleosyl)-tetraphosphatase (symmetrical) YqeK [Lachnospiraceae bacterium]MDY4206649.1 bis(5'-nucleosyl)-tetraphosphat
MEQKITKIRRKLMTELDTERYEHTLGVMYTAASMAMRYDEDVEKALLAGLLHDCAKCISGENKIKLCNKYHLSVSEVEKKNPSLLHAKLGAFLAAKKYHIKDKDVINAIASHTTGCPNMTLLDKIIYIADYIEPGRKELPNMAEVRKLAFTDINECLYRILEDSLVYLNSKNISVDPMTEKTYLYYKNKLNKEV